MTGALRSVFDVNIFVSALLRIESTPGQALLHGLRSGTVMLSPVVAQELAGVLSRPKFDRYVTIDERDRFLAALIRRCELVHVDQTVQVCRDASDDRVLELALCWRASFIVTGDTDLLALNPFRGIPIVTAAEFLQEAVR